MNENLDNNFKLILVIAVWLPLDLTEDYSTLVS